MYFYPDFLIHATCCKHVHLVKRFLDAKDGCDVKQEESSVINKSEIDDAFNFVRDEKENNFQEFVSCKQKLLQKWDAMRSEIELCTSNDLPSLRYLDKNITAATNTFQSMLKNKHVTKIPLKEQFVHNKNIDVQQKLRSATKRKTSTRVRHTKPTPEQQNKITAELVECSDTKLLKLLGPTHPLKCAMKSFFMILIWSSSV